MVSTRSKEGANDEIREEPSLTNGCATKNELPVYIRTSQRGLLDEGKPRTRFPNLLTKLQRIRELFRFKSTSETSTSSSKFWKFTDENKERPESVVSPVRHRSSKRFRVRFIQKINWSSLWGICKNWMKEPANMVLFVWILCVAISGAILFLVMTGMLNGVLPKKSQRNTWFEVNNQFLNALFTLMCLFQHPKRFHHLILLCRWGADDVLRLRQIYCKNGACKPNERMHIMVVLIFLHLNCFAQYALCALNWGFPRSNRPAIGVGVCVSLAIASPAIASLYNILSPLGREYETELEQEAESQTPSRKNRLRMKSIEKRYSFMSKEEVKAEESKPEWIGGLFDFWDDICLAYLSFFCTCCVFGWNMDRLGFGNMYVHIATFYLVCLAPFFIFNLAAVNIDNEAIREALGITGFVLCVLGLLYGGFWRIQMRKRFGLPPNNLCCGKPALTDCFQWLCCYACSLAQEVRTADYYDIVEGKFHIKQEYDSTEFVPSPLPREVKSDSNNEYKSHIPPFNMGKSEIPERFSGGRSQDWLIRVLEGETSTRGTENMMEPPAVSRIQ